MHLKIIIFLISFSFSTFCSQTKWKGSISDEFRNENLWKELIGELSHKRMNYGLLAAAERLLILFSSASSKEIAYRTIVALIDAGFPYSLNELFQFGDIDSDIKDAFMESYNFYKSIINKNKKMEKWAKYYLEKINIKTSKKYRFYNAIEKYKAKNLDESKNILYSLLSEKVSSNEQVFMKKVARTLARILFEERKFVESLAIYEDFLLKTNPVTPTDWLESAWTLYHLKRYEKALGNLYNLESSKIINVNLEKYIIRALIYRDTCSTNNMEELLKSYEKDFNKAIVGIKSGGTLLDFEKLKILSDINPNSYQEVYFKLKELNSEKDRITELQSKFQKLANYLYSSEIKRLQGIVEYYMEKLTRESANKLLMLNESIRFLTYDVERQKYNPDAVFVEKQENSSDIKGIDDFEIRWKQTGDYWGNERTKYIALLKNQCVKQ